MPAPTSRLRMLGWTHAILGGAGVLVCGTVVAACAALSDDPAYADEIVLLLGAAIVLAAAYFIPSLAGGVGLLLNRSWARAVLWIESALLLIAIPVGPLLAGYTLWALQSTRDAAWNDAMPDIVASVRRRVLLLPWILAGVLMLGAIVGTGYLFRDMIDPPGRQQLTPLPSGVPPQLSPDIQRPDFSPPGL